MIKNIFSGIKIENKRRFVFFTALYALTFVLFCLLCVAEAVMAVSLESISGFFLMIPGMSYAAYHGPLAAVIYVFVSFFEVLFIAWQTDLKGQRLNRFVLFFMAINLLLTVIGITLSQGLIEMIMALLFIALIIVVPTVAVVKVKEKNGTADYSDLMTPKEYAEYMQRKGK